LSHFGFVHPKAAAMLTLFIQSMLDREILASGQVYTALAHTDEHIDRYLQAVGDVFAEIAQALGEDSVERTLRGPVKHSGFQRLN